MKKELTTAQMLGICLGDFARAILSGLIVTYTLKFFNVTPSSGLPLLIPAGMMGTLRGASVIFDAIFNRYKCLGNFIIFKSFFSDCFLV